MLKPYWLFRTEPKAKGFCIILRVKEGAWDKVPFEEGATTLRTVCLLFVGEGAETISRAINSMLRPSYAAIDSKSASFSAAS
jgi:hypothetical protein